MPTGKTGETVKERLWFYSFQKKSQTKMRDFMWFVFNGVQGIHRRVTGNSAAGAGTVQGACGESR